MSNQIGLFAAQCAVIDTAAQPAETGQRLRWRCCQCTHLNMPSRAKCTACGHQRCDNPPTRRAKT